MKTTIAILLLSTGIVLAEPASTNVVKSTNAVQAAEMKQAEFKGRVVERVAEGILVKMEAEDPTKVKDPIKRIGQRSIASGDTKKERSPVLDDEVILLVDCPSGFLAGSSMAFVAYYGGQPIGGRKVLNFIRLAPARLK